MKYLNQMNDQRARRRAVLSQWSQDWFNFLIDISIIALIRCHHSNKYPLEMSGEGIAKPARNKFL